MHFNAIKSTYLFLFSSLILNLSCNAQKSNSSNHMQLLTGADQTDLYLKDLQGKKIAVVANQTSVIDIKDQKVHLIDFLSEIDNIFIQNVFAPEHGFRGKADAGETIIDGIDKKTGIPVISLYGKNKKPSTAQLQNIDLILFDIQDVGARFYTYISTLHYVMEACAEANIPIILLDRPNPNGHYIDGPVLEAAHSSFVGMHPVPIVYGMTIGEYGKMINGEQWLKKGIRSDLRVIPLKNYTHQTKYDLPIKPSPNLPNAKSINLYPSLCFFEGTNVSAGRGTDLQFQIYGSPFQKKGAFKFKPMSNEGAKYPKHQNKVCYGEDLREKSHLREINLTWLIKAYQNNENDEFFNSFFTKLAGTAKLQKQIEQGLSISAIKKSWKTDIQKFIKIRSKYLIYD